MPLQPWQLHLRIFACLHLEEQRRRVRRCLRAISWTENGKAQGREVTLPSPQILCWLGSPLLYRKPLIGPAT